MSVRIAVDAMGGDFAPGATVRGSVRALLELADLSITLVGDESLIGDSFSSDSGDSEAIGGRITVVHTTEAIPMDTPPVAAIRTFKNSSIMKMAELAVRGEVDAVLSAGNTGALAAVAQLRMKPLPGVTRPGIAVTIPSFHGPFVLCDVGANIQAKPRHLYEYAVMASLYAERVVGLKNPRVALVSIGEESGKGTGLVKETHKLLLADSNINFVGNAEGRELFENRCDVAICDGFVGNIVLKFVEGLAEGLLQTIKREFDEETPKLRERFNDSVDRVWARHDYSQYGGAPLLGVRGVCICCHGRSNEKAIFNAIKVADRFVRSGFNVELATRLRRYS